jgi:hypothetical protein
MRKSSQPPRARWRTCCCGCGARNRAAADSPEVLPRMTPQANLAALRGLRLRNAGSLRSVQHGCDPGSRLRMTATAIAGRLLTRS